MGGACGTYGGTKYGVLLSKPGEKLFGTRRLT
jgi:hypothetical protein